MNQRHLSNGMNFKGQSGEFFGIWIVNILLSIITLGLYSPWAKVRTMRYFYGNTFLNGDNFEYHATPYQILKGRLLALAIMTMFVIVNLFSPSVSQILIFIFYLAIPWFMWSNARFDAAMTSYRNVHFSFNASCADAYAVILGRVIVAFAIFFGLGILFSVVVKILPHHYMQAITIIYIVMIAPVIIALYAWLFSGVKNYFVNGYQYGNLKFSASLETGFFSQLFFKAFAISAVLMSITAMVILSVRSSFFMSTQSHLLLMRSFDTALFALIFIPALLLVAVVQSYITVRTQNYILSQLQLNITEQEEPNYQFKSTLKVEDHLWLTASNILIQIFTLGLARPWVMVRTAHYVMNNTMVIGDLEQLKAIGQATPDKSAFSDEVAQAYNIDLGIG
ncbi:hypothetical protein BS333_09165 [Vibrio azureus]|uniref:DUF898 domain-containing protein n=1 Tax=Vibrio azureus NBRC 104587 TaxID=1219077 RepID=U3ALI2_9VIBR|nr:YjgN family protein [Vibrio azureus]AUI86537.1 hypothetical protein BS333_09165 [Vibrio azureus]GAD74157.1 hypothetical protein VAZ01S_004_00310 [Vibrio azureus NBRC 104587]